MKKIITLLLCLVLTLTMFTACSDKDNTDDEIFIPIRQGNSVNYDTARAFRGTIIEEVTLQGGFTNPYSQNLAFTMTGGKMEYFDLHVDQSVKKGDLIANLSDDQLEEDIKVSKIKLDSAKATYDILMEKAPKSDETAFAKIDYDIAQTEYDALVAQREWLTIYAPFDGVITYVGNYWWGADVRQNSTVCTIVDSSRPRLTVVDQQNQLKNISFGTAVKVKQGAIASTTGKVVDVRTQEVRNRFTDESYSVNSYIIQVDDPEVKFEDFGEIQVIFTTLRRDDAIIVPTNAVYETDDGHYVNVLMNGVKVMVDVTVGIVHGDKTEILTGLDGTETIIL